MSESFKSRTAVVTAAGSGIGAAAALVADGGLTAQTSLPPFVTH